MIHYLNKSESQKLFNQFINILEILKENKIIGEDFFLKKDQFDKKLLPFFTAFLPNAKIKISPEKEQLFSCFLGYKYKENLKDEYEKYKNNEEFTEILRDKFENMNDNFLTYYQKFPYFLSKEDDSKVLISLFKQKQEIKDIEETKIKEFKYLELENFESPFNFNFVNLKAQLNERISIIHKKAGIRGISDTKDLELIKIQKFLIEEYPEFYVRKLIENFYKNEDNQEVFSESVQLSKNKINSIVFVFDSKSSFKNFIQKYNILIEECENMDSSLEVFLVSEKLKLNSFKDVKTDVTNLIEVQIKLISYENEEVFDKIQSFIDEYNFKIIQLIN